MNIGGFVGKSTKSIYKSCYVSAGSSFINLVSELSNQNVYVGGFAGQFVGDNEMYFCDLRSIDSDNNNPIVKTNMDYDYSGGRVNPNNNLYVGGFIGGVLYNNEYYTKGSVVASSLVQTIGFKNETTISTDNPNTYFGSFVGVVEDNDNNDKAVITFINCSSGSSVVGSNTTNLTRSVLAGLNNSESSVYYAVDTRDYSSATVTGYPNATPIYIATENGYKKYKNIGADAVAQVLATADITDAISISNILNYNSTQTFGPEGSAYVNKPEYNHGFVFKMDSSGLPGRVNMPGNQDATAYSREVEYTYDTNHKTNIKYIVGSNAQMEYDRTIELEHKVFSSDNTWYTDSNFETPASLNSITAGSKYVVYAKTEPEKYTLSFTISKTARNTPTESVQINYGASVLNSSVVVPVVTGYKFDGYYLSSDLSNPIINANGELITTNSTYFADNAWTYFNDNKTVELIAQWVEKSYTITFDVAGGNKEKPADQTTPFSTTTIPIFFCSRICTIWVNLISLS